MNVVLFTPFSMSDTGGVSVFVARFQESLARRGHHAVVLEAAGHKNRIAPASGGRPLMYAVNLRHLYVKGAIFKGLVAFWVYLPLALYDLWSFLRRERIDIVHVHFPTPRSLYLAVLRPISHWRLVVTFHGSDIYGSYGSRPRSWLYMKLLGRVLGLADRITAVSTELLKAVLAHYSDLRARSVAIRNGSPLAFLELAGGKPQAVDVPDGSILAVGSLIPRKGYDVLLRAIGHVRDRGRRPRLVIVGDGHEMDRLSALARELWIDNQVAFAGGLPHEDVLRLYASSKFLVHAARQEGLPLVILEAMACGKAVIATRVGGTPEIVRDGVTGLLVDADDPQSLASAIVRLEEDDQLRRSLGERAHEVVSREHNWEVLVDRYLQQYEIALGTPPCAAAITQSER